MNDKKIRETEWITTAYPTVCDQCGMTVPTRKRMLHTKIAGNHAYFCRVCAADPYQSN